MRPALAGDRATWLVGRRGQEGAGNLFPACTVHCTPNVCDTGHTNAHNTKNAGKMVKAELRLCSSSAIITPIPAPPQPEFGRNAPKIAL